MAYAPTTTAVQTADCIPRATVTQNFSNKMECIISINICILRTNCETITTTAYFEYSQNFCNLTFYLFQKFLMFWLLCRTTETLTIITTMTTKQKKTLLNNAAVKEEV